MPALTPCLCRQLIACVYAAPHGKAAGRTVDSRLADKNQHNTPPHHMLMQWIWDHFSEGSRFDTPSGASDQAASTSSAQPTSSRGPSSSRPKQHEGRTEAQVERDRQQKPGDAAGTVPRQEASVSLVYRSSKYTSICQDLSGFVSYG